MLYSQQEEDFQIYFLKPITVPKASLIPSLTMLFLYPNAP